MKILFYDTKSYDREFFEKLLPSYPGIEVKFIEANISAQIQMFRLVTSVSADVRSVISSDSIRESVAFMRVSLQERVFPSEVP